VPAPSLDLVHVLESDGFLFMRYRSHHAGHAPPVGSSCSEAAATMHGTVVATGGDCAADGSGPAVESGRASNATGRGSHERHAG
jgi:hypothetical protein